jgi:response regulator RpfG family c-di-GMP phosphodiesterase
LLAPNAVTEQVAAARRFGVDDVVTWPAGETELGQRVQAQLQVLEAEGRAQALATQARALARQMEQFLKQRDDDLSQVTDVLIYALSRVVELRRLETERHLRRLQGYVRVLAEEASRLPAFALIDPGFIRELERCVPLHDIGKVALPDHIFLKPGKLDAEERAIMESHTDLGAELLAAVGRRHGAALPFVRMATDLARHHHERFDGTGYPDHLSAEAIPLAARITTVADVYDALRSQLVYKPGLSHAAALRLMLEDSPGQFDPSLLVAFRKCETSFEQIFTQLAD